MNQDEFSYIYTRSLLKFLLTFPLSSVSLEYAKDDKLHETVDKVKWNNCERVLYSQYDEFCLCFLFLHSIADPYLIPWAELL